MSGCVILMIDESAAMNTQTAKTPGTPLTSLGGPAKIKAESVATAVNSLLNRLAQDPDCEVALIGYRTDTEGQADVGCRWGGALSGRGWVPAAELKGAEATVEKRVRKIPGPGGFIQEQPFDFPVWYQPQLGQKAPQIAAFHYCRQLLDGWAAGPNATGTPLLINIFAGSSADGNPLKATKEIMDLQTPGGTPLVVQIHLSSSDTVPPTLYPANRAYLAVGPMRDLFERASVLPDHLTAALKAVKVPINPKARGMIYHAKMEDVTRALGLISAHLKPVAPTPAAAPKRPPAASPLPPATPAPVTPVTAPTTPATPVTQTPPVEESFAPPPAEESFAPPVEESYAPPVEESYAPPAEEPYTPPLEESYTPPVAASPEPALGPITPDQPALVLFVLDRSVDDPFSGNLKNACLRLQGHLGALVEQIVKFGGGGIDVGVVSYGVDGMGEVEVRTMLEGGLFGRSFARDNELEAGAVRIDETTEEIPNGVGGLISISHRRPVLVEAEPTYATPATPAFAEVSRLVSEWCGGHPTAGGPPVVIHLTRGKLDTADAESAVAQLAGIATPSGVAPVLYHLVETEADHATVTCPGDESQLADPVLQGLWRLTAPLLGRIELAADKPSISDQSRGMVVNGKPNLLLDALRRVCD